MIYFFIYFKGFINFIGTCLKSLGNMIEKRETILKDKSIEHHHFSFELKFRDKVWVT